MSEGKGMPFSIALLRLWDRIANSAFDAHKKEELSAPEVRAYLAQQVESRSTTSRVARDWTRLPADDRNAVLTSLFSKDIYKRPASDETDTEMRGYWAREAQLYSEMTEQLIGVVGSNPILAEDAKAQAQQLMKVLKKKVKEDATIAESEDKMAAFTRSEREFFTMIQDVGKRLRIGATSDPIKAKWNTQLRSFKEGIQNYLRK